MKYVDHVMPKGRNVIKMKMNKYSNTCFDIWAWWYAWLPTFDLFEMANFIKILILKSDFRVNVYFYGYNFKVDFCFRIDFRIYQFKI